MEDLEDILLEMEQELAEGKKALFGGGVTVNAEVMYGLIDRIRNAMPDMVREARYIVQNNERFRQEETIRAQNMIAAAQQRSDQLVSEHYIAQEAQKNADLLQREAQEYCARLSEDVRKDIALLLGDTEKKLVDALDIIRRAQAGNRNH